MSGQPTLGRRVAIAALVAVCAGWYALAYARQHPRFGADFDQIWYAGRLLITGADPYEVVGVRGRDAIGWPWQFFYPLPAAVVGVLFAPLERLPARVVFVVATTFVFAFAVTRHRWEPLSACLSGAFLSSIHLAQWSPLLVAAAVYPWLGFAIACKPNVGLVSIAATRERRSFAIAVGSAAVLTLLTLPIDPSWPTKWRTLVGTASHFRPLIFHPFGWLPLLSLYRWRKPEARVLAALTLVPMTPGVREALFVWLAPLSWGQGLALAASSHFVTPIANRYDPGTQFLAFVNATSAAVLWLVYVPATIFVLVGRRERTTRSKEATE